MKQKIKWIPGLMLALVIAVQSGVTALAVTGQEPSAADANTVFIYGVEADVTVKAYQIIDAVYDEKGNGLTGYVVSDGLSIEDLENPTAETVNQIASDIYDGKLTTLNEKTLTYAAADTEIDVTTVTAQGSTADSYTTEEEIYYGALEAGMWIILVWDSNTTIYNPMIVSNWYEDANLASSLTSGSVDADGYFCENIYSYTIDDDGTVTYSNNDAQTITSVYAKKSSISVDKDIVNYTGAAEDEAALEGDDPTAFMGNLFTTPEDEEATQEGDPSHGDDASDGTEGADYEIGDAVQFEIKTTIPDYAETYFTNETHDATFTIIDALSAGFDAVSADDITVTVGGTEYEAGSDTYSITLYDAYDYNGNIYYLLYDEDYNTYSIWTKNDDGTYALQKKDLTAVPDGYSAAGQEIVIDFAESFIKEHGFESVVVSFSAVLNQNALIVGGESAYANPNSVDLVYSNHPTTVFHTDENGSGDTVYVYTFSLTDEIAKVFNDDDGDADDEEGTASAEGNAVTVTNPLAGATFTIYYDASCADGYEYTAWIYDTDEDSATYGELIQSASMTTAADGLIQFYGLSEGTYYITETDSPSGYSVNDTIYQVVIDAVYDTAEDTSDGDGASSKDGLLTSWSVSVTPGSYDKEAGTFAASAAARVSTYAVTYATTVSYYDYTADEVVSSKVSLTNYDTVYTLCATTVTAGGITYDSTGNAVTSDDQAPTAILNTRLIQLPSTGGTGLYILIGASAVLFACVLFISARRKKKPSDPGSLPSDV